MEETVANDSLFFTKLLDYIPREVLKAPLSDAQKEENWKKQNKNNHNNNNRRNQNEKFKLKSNALHIADLLTKMDKEKIEENQRALKNEVLSIPENATNKALTAAQLKEKMEKKILEERKRNGYTAFGEEKPIKKPRHDFDKRNNPVSISATNNNNSLNKMKFNIKDSREEEEEVKNKKSPKTSIKSIENIQKLIKKTEKQKEKVEKYKQEGNFELVDRMNWEKLEKKAKGEKMRDDSKLLKKSLRKLKSKKKKSSMEWKERKKEENKGKNEKVQKREANILARKKRPGFEGNVNTILNAD